MMRLRTYGGLSLVATVAVIYHAFKSRGQFYPAMVYLSTSKISLVLLLNMGFAVMCSLWNLTKRIFLGTLREAEVERLNEQLWREVMEILFAITIFRQDFSVMVVVMVAALLFVKALHWLAQKRVEYIETTPSVTMLSHVRIVSFLGFLLLLDSLFLYDSAKVLIETRQPSVSLFFSFEYMILATTSVSTFIKYVFHVSDMLMEGQWERKAVYTFYLELIRDLLHLSMYLCFFLVIFMNYGVPLHLIRELYETFRNFRIRIADYIRYRKITSNMNDRFPDATPEELDVSDATCIICREEMTTAKKLICGHLFHVHCLRSWLERQHTCPTCRALVIPSEGGASAPGGQQGLQPDAHRQGTLPASTAADNSSGGVASNGVSQHHARLQAAAAAASVYGKSFVYPSANTAAWFPGYAFLPQSQRPSADSTNMESGGDGTFFGQPGAEFAVHTGSSSMQFPRCFMAPFEATSNLTSGASLGSISISDSDLEAQIRFIQQQIEVLQFQLQHLQKSKAEEDIPAGTSGSSGSKGKTPVTSSTSDCGHHTGLEDGDDHIL